MSASDLRDAVRRIVGERAGVALLKPAPEKGARPGVVATGRPSSAGNTANTESLVELDFDQREYWAEVAIDTSDGIFTLTVEPIKRVVLEGDRVFDFKQPT